MQTAANRIAALNNSCPTPSTAAAISPANPATSAAPSTPAAQPPAIHRPRPGTPRLAAMTMPSTSPASSTSRETMIRVASMTTPLFHDQMAAVFRVEVVEEFVAAGVEGADEDRDLVAGCDDLLAMDVGALKFRRGLVLIADDQF